MSDQSDSRSYLDEPSNEEFEAAEQEAPPTGPRAVLFRVLRVVGVLLVIVALLLYLLVPFGDVFRSIPDGWPWPRTTPRTIPLAPEQQRVPTLPV